MWCRAFLTVLAASVVVGCSPAAGPDGAPVVSANEITCLNPVALERITDALMPQLIEAITHGGLPSEQRRLVSNGTQPAFDNFLALRAGDGEGRFEQTVTLANDSTHALCESDIFISNPLSVDPSFGDTIQVRENEVAFAQLVNGEPQIDARITSIEGFGIVLRQCAAAGWQDCRHVRGELVSYREGPNTSYLANLEAVAHVSYTVDRTEQGTVTSSIISVEWREGESGGIVNVDLRNVFAAGERQNAAPYCALTGTRDGQVSSDEIPCPPELAR